MAREEERTLPLARDMMATRLVTAAPDEDVLDAAGRLLRWEVSGAPVIAPDGTFLGTLSERSCMRLLTAGALEAERRGEAPLRARDFMVTEVVTLDPDTDALEAVELLLDRRFSGAPVVDREGAFLGIFSERYVMSLLVRAAYEQVPAPSVGAFMNTDRGRLISEETDLATVARIFLDRYYRRLPVLRGDQLVGQISHRDVLRAEHPLARQIAERVTTAGQAPGTEHGSPVRPSGAERPSSRVSSFMSVGVETISEETDFLAIAQLFLDSNRRRLPVLRQGILVGQVSRRDLLRAALDLLRPEPRRERGGLYLSAVMDRGQRPLLNRADYNRGGRASAHPEVRPPDRDRDA